MYGTNHGAIRQMDNSLVVIGIDEKLNDRLGSLLEQLGLEVTVFSDVVEMFNYVDNNSGPRLYR